MPSSTNNSKWIVVTLVALLVISTWMLKSHRHQAATPSAPAQTQASNTPPVAISLPVTNLAATQPAAPTNAAPDKFQQACDAVKSAPDAATARRRLAELRDLLSKMPKDEATAAVRKFLNSKTDAPTHLGFKVASNGLLDDAPTLRTFMLDELGRLDSSAAADYSKTILASMDSPDEWALALRNLARGDTSDDGRSLLAEKTGEMLQYSSWQQDPSVGYLEAFDAAVYLGGTNLMPTLSDMVKRTDNPAVTHAAYLALDRLVINDPSTTLAALATDPNLMQGREATRADYFARADVRDPQQKQVLENYLLNPQTSPAEIAAFAGVYPNANFMISPNLLTQTPTPDHAALVSRDAASLAVAHDWLADPRFSNLQAPLMRITSRLQEFARQSAAGH